MFYFPTASSFMSNTYHLQLPRVICSHNLSLLLIYSELTRTLSAFFERRSNLSAAT